MVGLHLVTMSDRSSQHSPIPEAGVSCSILSSIMDDLNFLDSDLTLNGVFQQCLRYENYHHFRYIYPNDCNYRRRDERRPNDYLTDVQKDQLLNKWNRFNNWNAFADEIDTTAVVVKDVLMYPLNSDGTLDISEQSSENNSDTSNDDNDEDLNAESKINQKLDGNDNEVEEEGDGETRRRSARLEKHEFENLQNVDMKIQSAVDEEVNEETEEEDDTIDVVDLWMQPYGWMFAAGENIPKFK